MKYWKTSETLAHFIKYWGEGGLESRKVLTPPSWRLCYQHLPFFLFRFQNIILNIFTLLGSKWKKEGINDGVGVRTKLGGGNGGCCFPDTVDNGPFIRDAPRDPVTTVLLLCISFFFTYIVHCLDSLRSSDQRKKRIFGFIIIILTGYCHAYGRFSLCNIFN